MILSKFDLEPGHFSSHITDHGVTLLDITYPYWLTLVQKWLREPELTLDSPLRIFIGGVAVMPAEVLSAWMQLPLSKST